MITVIINVYNAEKYIKKCLDSIINQTYKDLEILIINDGSTDKTLSICKKYKDKRIRIISTDNKGLALSRNVGLDNAKGDYIYFVDVDDYIENDTIEYLYNLCKKYNSKFSTCRSKDVYSFDIKKEQPKEKIEILSNYDMLKKVFIAEDNAVATWNKLIKKDLYKDLRFESRISDDIAFTHKLILRTNKIVYSNQIKYYYLKHNESICSKEREDLNRVIDMYQAAIERYNYVKEIYPNFIENNVGILELITRLYLRKNEEIIKELNNRNVVKTFNELFSFKVFRCKMKLNKTIKILFFRISPRFYLFIIKTYLKIRGKK